MNTKLSTIVCLILFTTCIFWVLRSLFYPELGMLVTPDLGRSDAWHFSFATKHALSQALQSDTLPLWRNDMGMGFPLFAEGQSGALFIPNIVLFRLFPPVLAYNLALVTTLLLLATGIFVWMRVSGASILASFFAGSTAALGAYPMMQLPHITLLQGTAMMGFVWAGLLTVFRRPTGLWIGMTAFIVSQQLFAGFPQASFLTYLVALAYALWESIHQKTIKFIWVTGVVLSLGFTLSAVQLVPSYEFLQESLAPGGFDAKTATFFSFPLGDLATLLDPFAIGNPKTGYYNQQLLARGNIVWENTIYIGIVPLLLAVFALLKTYKDKQVVFMCIVGVTALLLAWGKYSPLYFVYTMWPFTLFRVPSRFIWIFALVILFLGTRAIDWIQNRTQKPIRKLALYALLFVHVLQLTHMWHGYHLIEPADDWITPPWTVNHLLPGRTVTIGEHLIQQRYMTQYGWTDPEKYRAFRDGLSPASNIIWNVPHQQVYAGRFLLRPTAYDDLLMRQSIAQNEHNATMSALTYKLFDLFGVSNVLSFVPLTQTKLTHDTNRTKADTTLWVYHNTDTLNRVHSVYHATAAATFEQMGKLIQDPAFDPRRTVLLEDNEVKKHPFVSRYLSRKSDTTYEPAQIKTIVDTHMLLTFQVTTEQDAIIVVADTAYPGWLAWVDNEPTPIFTANFSQRAIVVPAGKHIVTMKYQPRSLKTGVWISVVASGVTVLLVVSPFFSVIGRRRQKNS